MGSYSPPPSVTLSRPALSQPKKTNLLPEVEGAEAAKKAAKGGMWAAFFVAGVTTLFAILAMNGTTPVAGINGAALLDAAVFIGIGIGIGRLSRIAAVAGLVIYIAERLYMMSLNGPAGLWMTIALTLVFINSVRGTFAYHRIAGTA